MSRLGKRPILIPDGVKAEIVGDLLKISGPKGELKLNLFPEIKVEINGQEIITSMAVVNKKSPALWGTLCSNIVNMLKGVTQDYTKKLEMVGVGYRAKQISPNHISLTVGYSHPVEFKSPDGVTLEVEENSVIVVKGISKEMVGLTASQIKKIKKPEPYKGKGIKYFGESVRRKAGKSAKA